MFPASLLLLDRPAMVRQAEPAPATPWIEMLVGSLPSARLYVFGAIGDLVDRKPQSSGGLRRSLPWAG